jgi:hypothetical protein
MNQIASFYPGALALETTGTQEWTFNKGEAITCLVAAHGVTAEETLAHL